MTWLQIVIFSLVEGISEFLPVSSTAHLLLLERFWGVANQALFDTVLLWLQLSAALVLVWLFFRSVWQHKEIWWKLILATLPALIIGVKVYPKIKRYLSDTSPLTGWMLILFGIVFTLIDWWLTKKQTPLEFTDDKQLFESYVAEVKQAPWWKMLEVGLAQSLAIVPGVSRSGATIFGARLANFSKAGATMLAFVLAIPTLAGASVLDLWETWQLRDAELVCDCYMEPCDCPPPYNVFNDNEAMIKMAVAAVLTLMIAALAVKPCLKYLVRRPFYYLGIYRIVVGIIWLLSYYLV
ncbi:undecaprenyl-diphosphate phosphatase [bacterium]|nr:undecaprenyl-diphosphate phosphatase [bacterium]